MRNPFRRQKTEQRTLDVGDVNFPLNEGLPLVNEAIEARALRLAPVFAAGRVLATSVSELPIQVYRKTSAGARTKLPTPPLLAQPSAIGTLGDWIERAMLSLVYRGNAVGIVVTRDALEYPTQIEWLNPDLVMVTDQLIALGEPGSFTNPLWFYNGQPVPAEDLVHVPWLTLPSRVWGLSPLGAAAANISIGLGAQQFSADWFNNGGVPTGTFANTGATVDQKEANTIKTRLMAAIRSHQPIVYGKDWQYTAISVSPNEAQFIDTMKLGATQIAAIYGIPAEMIGGETGGKENYSSPEQREIEFIQRALLPWVTKLEAHLSQLLPRGQYMKFNVDALIRVDAKTRIENYEKQRLIGLASLDEMRELEDLPPLPNGQGQDYTPLPIQAGMVGVKISTPPIRSHQSLRLVSTGELDGSEETA